MYTLVKYFPEHLEYKCESTKINKDTSEQNILSILHKTKN